MGVLAPWFNLETARAHHRPAASSENACTAPNPRPFPHQGGREIFASAYDCVVVAAMGFGFSASTALTG
jgi:hypothetical protein